MPRFIPENSLVEVTMRTIQGRFLLRPSDAVNDRVLGVFGRAQHLYGMKCCGLTVLSNHWHALYVPEDAEHLAVFMRHVATNLSKEIGRLHDWRGSFWERRYSAVVVSDEERAQVGRLRYLLANGAKEGLVSRACDWPGVHSVGALVDDQPLFGTWIDRTALYRARQRKTKKPIDESDFATVYPFLLSLLPCWSHLLEREHRDRVAELVEEIERDAREERAAKRSVAMGPDAILSQHPHAKPTKVDRSPVPFVHAATKKARLVFFEARQLFTLAHRAASRALRIEGRADVVFPDGSFPPSLPFVRAGPPPAWKSSV